MGVTVDYAFVRAPPNTAEYYTVLLIYIRYRRVVCMYLFYADTMSIYILSHMNNGTVVDLVSCASYFFRHSNGAQQRFPDGIK